MKRYFKNWILKRPNRLRVFLLLLIKSVSNKYLLDKEESRTFLFAYHNKIVRKGPFKGMKYIAESNGSVLFPKIVGLYEEEIHLIIQQIVSNNYSNIIDIGCAEGYYAAGLAYKLRILKSEPFKVYAFDIDPIARTNASKLIQLNNLESLVEVGKEFQTVDFNRFDSNTVVICDIEGDEIDLLQPHLSSMLLCFDLLVEVHDAGDKNGQIKNALKERFSATHEIEIYHHRTNKERVFRYINPEYEKSFMNEGRTFGLEWMWMKRKKQ